jgi:hypothetical protein
VSGVAGDRSDAPASGTAEPVIVTPVKQNAKGVSTVLLLGTERLIPLMGVPTLRNAPLLSQQAVLKLVIGIGWPL